MSLAPGTRLGSYEIVSLLGHGGMGDVYRARDLKLGREVALKVLSPDLSRDSERLRRFEQEARAASSLSHPNIVHIYDVGESEGLRFIAMELAEGDTLRRALAQGPLEPERLLSLARQLADGVAKAHAAGIVHRDLKPENVMVSEDDMVKILDFGLAKLAAPAFVDSEMATVARTQHGVLIGTVEYMSPEQASGKSADSRADQFSLGLIFYEMATGRIAFHRETAAQTLASIIESEPTPMAGLNARIPQGLERVVNRCLSKDPARRYPDTRELARELKSLSPAVVPEVRRSQSIADEVNSYVLAEVRRELQGATRYQLDSEGKVRTLSEARLRKRLRQNRYSGLEMVKREGDDVWVPLHETSLFREEVPARRDPATWALKRKATSFAEHLTIYLAFALFWFLARGEVPFWMGFWGIGLAAHAVTAVPAAISLWRSRKPSSEPAPAIAAPDLLSAGFRDEVERVRGLLERRGGESKAELLKEIDAIVTRMRDLVSKRRDLEEQTGAEERARLEKAEKDAAARLEAATTRRERSLYEKQLAVVRERRRTIDKALAVLEHLRVRQDVAEHQVKKLRLDLSRAEASSGSVPELSSRLSDIRHEVDAAELVDEALA
ncbi:MAG TPA: protein kinase [Vicinamibacteria bacterium]|nr:protein kinase [Vicinamibacteria bacterium]